MRATSFRTTVEGLLHAAATIAIAMLLWRSLRPDPPLVRASASTSDLAAALPGWTRDGAPDSLSLHLDRVPDPATRDWLVALRRAGTRLAWSSARITPSAMTVEHTVDPQGGVLVRVAAPAGARVAVGDEAGVIDSLRARAGVATFRLAALAGMPRASTGEQSVHAALTDSIALRRLLVLGRVGWEAKFTIAALEERGWSVDTRLGLAPGTYVTQGSPARVDTSRYSAVIVLDSAGVGDADAIVRYVDDGGGLVVAGAGALVPAFARVLPGRPGKRVVSPQRLIDTSDADGARYPITALRHDALVLARADTVVTLAARRAGAGRVAQIADAETWRRRLRPARGSVGEHRDWWTRIAGSVAYVPRVHTTADTGDPAPVASLIATLGFPSPRLSPIVPARVPRPEHWLFAIVVMALIAEWTSRRWRGAT